MREHGIKKIINPKTGYSLFIRPFKDNANLSEIIPADALSFRQTAPQTNQNEQITDIKNDISLLNKQTKEMADIASDTITHLNKRNKTLSYALIALSITLVLSILL